MRPRLVLLDACGVILNDPLPGLIEALGQALEESTAETLARYATLRPRFWTGQIGEEAFWTELCAGLPPDPWARRLAASFAPGPASGRLGTWSRRARLRVLSNHRTRWMESHLTRFELGSFLEKVLVSDAIGYAKPDVQAFEAALADTDLESGEVLFVDDKQRNIRTARALGLQAVWADPASDWLSEVDSLLSR